MAHSLRIGALASLAAAAAFTATPASAAELPTSIAAPAAQFSSDPAFNPFSIEADTAKHHRYRRYRGWGRHRGWRRHRRVDAGDVVAGVLILGGIAAIASAASKNNRDRYRERDYRYRDRDYRDRDRNYRERRGDSRYDGGRGIDNAVSQCVSEIERDVRVDRVDSVDRAGDGWRVTGALYNGERFTCRIDNNGRIDGVDYGAGDFSGVATDGAAEGQWTDARYTEARRAQGLSGPAAAQPQPAYPGGPLPGEDIDSDLGG